MVVAAAATSILSLYGTPVFADSDANAAAKDSPGVGSGNNLQLPLNVPLNACGNTVNVIGALNPAFGNSCANGSGSGNHGSPGAPHGSSGSGDSAGYGSDDQSGGHNGAPGGGSDDVLSGGSGDVPSGGSGSGAGGDSGASAHAETYGSPGVLSGNNVQAPVDVPVNACGNSANVVGAGNPAFGNDCENGPEGYGDTPPTTPPTTPPAKPPTTPRVPPTKPPTSPPKTPPTTPSTPPTRPGHPRSLPHTGSEGLLAASAASAAMLIGGTVLYRRGRAASRR